MYCGTNRTALASQEQIAGAIVGLLEERPYASISISELCKAARVSRQTFYSLFASKDNVMIFILQERYRYEPAPEGEQPSCLQQLCRNFSRYLVTQQDFIRTLAQNQIMYLLNDSLFRSLLGCGCILEGIAPPRKAYAASFLAGGFTSIATTYVQEGCQADAAFLYQLCIDFFRGLG